MLKAAERFAVNYSIPIALIIGAQGAFILGYGAAAAGIAEGSALAQRQVLGLLGYFANRQITHTNHLLITIYYYNSTNGRKILFSN
jgi:hypothetical protein